MEKQRQPRRYPSEFKTYPRVRNTPFNIKISEKESEKFYKAMELSEENKKVNLFVEMVNFYIENKK